MSGLTGAILPCAACATTGEQLSAILSLLMRQNGYTTVTQSSVAVNGDNVTLAAAGTGPRTVILQNVNGNDVFVKLGTGAVNTGAGGEHVLHKAGGSFHGDGGVLTVPYNGLITGASTGATNVSVIILE